MTSLFNRVANLVLITETDTRIFSGLKITFDIEKDDKSNANKGKFIVYNLNPESIELFQSENAQIIFSAGYKGLGDDDPLVEACFQGDITKAIPSTQGVNRVLTIEAGDAEDSLKDTSVNKSWGPKTAIKTIISDVAKSFGLPLSNNSSIDAKAASGLALSGKAKNALDVLALNHGLKWSVQNGELFVYDTDADTSEDVIILKPSTGLISANKKISKDVGENPDSIEFTGLLNPRIRPGRVIEVDGVYISGQYVVSKVQVTGDTHDGHFILKGVAA